MSLHDRRWPGRRLANVDHVVIGPGGVFVVDSKNWSGAITVTRDVLRQNGRPREEAVASAADAALAVGELIAPYAAWVHPVLCFIRDEPMSGWARDVMICTTGNIAELLTTRPAVFTPAHVAYISAALDRRVGSATTPSRRPAGGAWASVPARPAVATHVPRHTAPSGTRSFQPPVRARSSRQEPRTLFAIVLLALVLGIWGPSVGAAIGAKLADSLVSGRTTCPAGTAVSECLVAEPESVPEE